MNTQRRLVKVFGGVIAVLALVGAAQFVVNATPPSGISFVPVSRATMPDFNVNRKNAALDWEIELEAPQPIDVATQIVTFQPGGYSGWHTHPGPVFFTVKTGTLTVYEAEDPTCTPHVFTAGTGAVEAGTETHAHMVRNETGAVAEAVVTYMVPVGTPQSQLRADRPYPGNCPF